MLNRKVVSLLLVCLLAVATPVTCGLLVTCEEPVLKADGTKPPPPPPPMGAGSQTAA